MQLQGNALRVTIYIGESDRYHGRALYMALLELLRKEGASGATVTRGLAGFGAHSRIHTATILTLSEDLPLRLEWVDQPELVERLLPQVRGMVDDGLITVEEVEVVQYAPGRRPDPLVQPVDDVMRTEVVTVQPDTPLAEVVALLLQRGYRSLPVVDGAGRLLGLITDGDLLRHANLLARLDLQTELSEAQMQQQLAAVRTRPERAADVMTMPVITIPAGATVRQAVTRMVENNLKRLPVVDQDEHLAGWISRVDVLRTVDYHQAPRKTGPARPRRGTTVSDLMLRDVPTVRPEAQLEEIIRALESSRRRRAVVVNEERRVLGIITDGDLLSRTGQTPHPGLLERLRHLVPGQDAPPPGPLPQADETAADLMTAPAITITPDTPLAEALRLTLRHKIKRLPVVDDDGRLLGLLGRASLLRGLLPAGGTAGDTKDNG